MKTEPIVIERSFNAPVDLVWKALTEKDRISQWSFEVADFQPEVGFEFRFDAEKDGVTYIHLCKVTEAIPSRKLAYTWRYQGHEGNSLVTIELAPTGRKTRVKLTHEGVDTFPQMADFAKDSFVQGWTKIVGTFLKEYVEQPGADTSDREILISRVFDAPRDLVWNAWTDPTQVVHWWGPRGFTTTVEEMDVRPGGAWKLTMHGPDGAEYPNKSIFREVVKPERIVFSHGGVKKDSPGAPGATFEATWTFHALDATRTEVTVHMIFPTSEALEALVKAYGLIEGGKQTLARLGEYLEFRRA